ncbi:type II toxin-antitoxin system PemK/MazF family toxin [Candidatus Saccharibacteria bacterium]|nr:type II toxin-antitoxin system PemK/MazF family toxin [Candidatus Saccharibacteria bacterium]
MESDTSEYQSSGQEGQPEVRLSNTEKAAVIKMEFNRWNNVKINLELHGRQPNPSQGEIWWAGVGKNLGAEIYGKSNRFARPVLIYKKLSRHNFMGIPLTSKEHEGSWYISFCHNGKKETAMLHQARVMSMKRLYRGIGEIDDADYERIRAGFAELYC